MKNIKLFIIFIAIFLFSITMVSASQVHVVKKGESIVDIAAMYDTTPLELAVANDLNLETPLTEGHKLIIVKLNKDEILNNISSPSTHKVAKGETVSSVAKKYGISAATLAKINHIKTTTKLAACKILQLITPAEEYLSINKIKMEGGNQAMVNFAMTLQGTRYVSGGTSRGGFDCSGLTSYVYKQFGKKIPRTSAAQFKGGKKVAAGDLQKGDIVCFTTRRSGCSHVGIYIGNNKFIHASTHRTGVIVSSLSEKYYASRYLGARRY